MCVCLHVETRSYRNDGVTQKAAPCQSRPEALVLQLLIRPRYQNPPRPVICLVLLTRTLSACSLRTADDKWFHGDIRSCLYQGYLVQTHQGCCFKEVCFGSLCWILSHIPYCTRTAVFIHAWKAIHGPQRLNSYDFGNFLHLTLSFWPISVWERMLFCIFFLN